MAHIIMLVEGYSDSLRKFEEEMNGRVYANGKAKLRIREAKLYTCSINKEGLNECLADIKGLSGKLDLRSNRTFKQRFMTNIIKLVLRLFGVKDSGIDKLVANPMFGKPRAEGGITYNAHFEVLGIVPDYVDKDGVEQV